MITKEDQYENLKTALKKYRSHSFEVERERHILKKLILQQQKHCAPIAILSTTVFPLDGTYKVETLPTGEIPDISGVPYYIGHHDTKQIVESLGAVKAPTNLFEGLREISDYAICFSIKQGMSTRKEEGFTSPHQNIDITMLDVKMITRIE